MSKLSSAKLRFASVLGDAAENPTINPEVAAYLKRAGVHHAIGAVTDGPESSRAKMALPSLLEMGVGVRTGAAWGAGLTRDQRATQDRLRVECDGLPNGGACGAIFPWSAERRTFSATGVSAVTGDAGGMTIGVDVPEILEAFRDKLVLRQLGATILPGLKGSVNLPREKPGLAPEWKAENDTPTVSNATFNMLSLSPKRLTVWTDVSSELLLMQEQFEAFVGRAIGAALAEAAQQAIISGTGSNSQPMGILHFPGTTSIADAGGNGSAPTYADLGNLEYAVTNAKADRGNLGFVTSPKVRKALRKIFVNGTGSLPLWPIDHPDQLWGYNAGVSTSSPDTLVAGGSGATLSAIIFGEFSELFVGLWGPGLIVDAVPIISGSDGQKGLIRYITTVYLDCGILTPAAFAVKPDCIV